MCISVLVISGRLFFSGVGFRLVSVIEVMVFSFVVCLIRLFCLIRYIWLL